ncbi:MAG: metallophosphoesterase [Burkholderiaceae bacterium]|nr:metallophosphoesterase [Aquabacterium sp.]NUP87446.1 metallophosphoesterase [Burkholderiaceae bacterium]
MNYDVIADIHGQYQKLLALLQSLGYRKRQGAFRHPDGRQAIFLGDLIDRGPLQEEVLYTVRDMIEAGTARCIMGNHEWNAIGYATPIGDGQYGHARSPKNLKHHHVFLDQVGPDSPRHKAWVEWFKTLPPLLDLGGIRVAHACWRQSQIDVIQSGMRDGRLTEQFLAESFQKKPAPSAARLAMDLVTKGPEIKLPNGQMFHDHEGTPRVDIRLQWWNEDARTYRNAAMVPTLQIPNIPDEPLPDGVEMGTDSDKPVLVGHYWLNGRPGVRSGKVAVLDYSAAGDGPLVAYRWGGEPVLSDDKLIAVGGWS